LERSDYANAHPTLKNKLFITLIVIGFLAVVLLWLAQSRLKPKPDVAAQAPASNALIAVNPLPAPSGSGVKANSNVSAVTVPAGQATSQAVDSASAEERLHAEIEAKNVPLDFYGQVIDQDTNPLSGVKIDARVRHWSTESFGSIHIEKETDAGGRFDIHGVTGDSIGVEGVGKDGYELEPSTQRNYGAVGGSIENPVVFKMWSTNINAQLITGEKSFQIVPDGSSYFIDLSKGTIAESGTGDLKVWVKRPDQITYGQRYNWSCELDVVNGGLLAEADASSSMYSAPVDGYTPSFQFEQKIGSGWGDSTGPKRFYVKLSNGQEYGRITIELMAYYTDQIPGMVRLSYAINPSGSQLLR